MTPAPWYSPMSPASATPKRAVEAGADGLVLLTAGAGGQTGWLNPFVFVRAVRAFFDGPVVLAGGISDGHALRAAQALGCDLAYMGTNSSPPGRAWRMSDTRRCWSRAAPTISC